MPFMSHMQLKQQLSHALRSNNVQGSAHDNRHFQIHWHIFGNGMILRVVLIFCFCFCEGYIKVPYLRFSPFHNNSWGEKSNQTTLPPLNTTRTR